MAKTEVSLYNNGCFGCYLKNCIIYRLFLITAKRAIIRDISIQNSGKRDNEFNNGQIARYVDLQLFAQKKNILISSAFGLPVLTHN